MDISVIIVNYNTLELTKRCLDSLFEMSSGVNFEVILVDNCSSDGSAEHFAHDSRIKFFASHANIGFGRANNLALAHAKGDYILFLNPDTELLNNALKIFHDYMQAAPTTLAAVGTQLLNAEGEKLIGDGAWGGAQSSVRDEVATIVNRILRSCKLKAPRKISSSQKLPFEVGYIVGADLFVRREVLAECGGFDPDFFIYFEEVELQHRFSKAGYRLQIIDGPRIIHYVKASSGGVVSFNNRLMSTEGRFLYISKISNYASYLLFRLIFLINLPNIWAQNYTIAERWRLTTQLFRRSHWRHTREL